MNIKIDNGLQKTNATPGLSPTRRFFLGTAAAAAVGLSAGTVFGAAAKTPARKPNFIVILCDDMGYGDWGKAAKGLFKTPNLERMAREGTVLTEFYSGASVCTPSRAGLLTGSYPIRHGMARGVILLNDKWALPVDAPTIPKVLGGDYASALIGKWHLGHNAPNWAPTNYGFNYFFGIPYSHDMKPLKMFESTAPRNLTELPFELSMLQQSFYDKAETFISENADKPFFLELALSAPHLPAVPPAKFKGTTKAGLYGDVIEEVDDIVGRLLNHLKKLKLDKDTLVVFTSDNGPWYEGSTGGLRDRKGGDSFEGAYRVPMIVWQPGRVPAGKTTNAIGSSIDFLPTFAAMAGKSLPEGRTFDGVDLTATLLRGAPSPHKEILLFSDEDVVGIRTQRWKYATASHYYAFNFSIEGRGYPQLYDMTLDQAESYSVASLHPDVLKDFQARMAQVRTEFEPLRTQPSKLRGLPSAPKQD
jgi:arylsulfatase A